MRIFLRRLGRYLVRLIIWLIPPPAFWSAGLGVGAAALVMLAMPICAEQRVRLAGLLLELLGVGSVAKGIIDMRRQFGREPIVRAWWKSMPQWRQDHRIVAGTAQLGTATGKATGFGTVSLRPGAPIEERVAALEVHAKNLNGQLQRVRADLDAASEKQQECLAREADERAKEDKSIRELLEEVMAGGLVLEGIGLVWILLGTILSTASMEILALAGIAIGGCAGVQ